MQRYHLKSLLIRFYASRSRHDVKESKLCIKMKLEIRR